MTLAPASFADLQSAAAGDPDAYHRVVYENRNLVSSIAYAVVRDLSSSEDIAQEVFLHAWVGLKKLKSPESFLPWLRQLTRNRAQQFLRERHRRMDRPVGEGLEALKGAVDRRPSAESRLLEAEQERRLAAAIDALPDDTRETVLLFYREGRSVAQVATLLELGDDAVKKRLSRARDRLREALDTDVATLAEKSALDGRFCAAVVAALPLSGPSAGAGVGTALLNAGVVGKALAAAAGAGAGGLMGVLGVLDGHRRELKRARDEAEREELRRIRNVGLVLTLSGSALCGVGGALGLYALVLVSGYLFVGAMVYLYGVRLTRLKRRRWALELAEDPTAPARQRREKWMSYGGLILGAATSLGTLLWLSLHLA